MRLTCSLILLLIIEKERVMKKIVMVVLFLFLVSGVYSGYPGQVWVRIVNLTGGNISVIAAIMPLEPNPDGDPAFHYIVDPPDVPVTIHVGVVAGTVENPFVVPVPKAGYWGEYYLFTYRHPSRLSSFGYPWKETIVFDMIPAYERFKMIYKDFLVLDEDGNKILDYETITPGHFSGNDLIIGP
jgi:hypothetical protein